MARKKSPDKATNFSVRVGEEELAALQDLARLSRTTVSEMIAELCIELIKANRQRIANFKRQASTPIKKPTFAVSPKKKDAAPLDTNAETKGDDSNGEE